MKYREHKGGIKESMTTVREIDSLLELERIIKIFYNYQSRSIVEIQFKYIGYDPRTGWDTYYVMQRLNFEENFRVVGMSDGVLDNENK